jgi:DNA-nicking Smr family endonuclease
MAAPPPSEKPKPKAPALAPLAPLERRLKRRLSSGKAQVDDLIDLHGLTQAQAHRTLNNFLWRSAENGAKLVLIITGKGSPGADDGHYMAERGVLRRNAPHWLRAPELRAIVLSVEEAARPHGGAGALYVRLRRRFPG